MIARLLRSPRCAAALLCLVLGLPTLSNAQRASAVPAPVDQVDPLIGSLGLGNVFSGATTPFGFIQVGPDTGEGSGASGYKNDRHITGFSQQHLSGMGGPLFGQVSMLPMTGPLQQPSTLASTGKSDEVATPGYYAVTLAPWGTRAELTATRRVALHRYTFPAHASSRILVDVGACLYGTGNGWHSAQPIGGVVQVDVARREVYGEMQFEGGRYEGAKETMRRWKVFFSMRFDTPPAAVGTWDDAGTLTDGAVLGRGREIGAYLNFNTRPGQVIQSKVAVSFHSVERARGYLAREAPGWRFEQARREARAAWARVLDTIQVEGGTPAQRTAFYSAYYRMHLTPNDWTGEAPPGRDPRQPYYENILCLWDTFRTVNPMLTLVQPKVQAGIVNTLLSHYRHKGWTGDAHSAWSYEHVQNGSNADVVIADAFVKQLPGIDWPLAYQAIRKNAFVDPNPDEQLRPHIGRYRLDDYRRHGYLPSDIASFKVQGVSRTLEYVYNDFAVLTLARRFGTPQEVADLEGRLGWYRNLWDPATGFMRGRNEDGSWTTPFDPVKRETGSQYYEGHAWTWSWYVPHDVQGLINLHGSKAAFVEKLTTAVDSHYEAHNEPGMLQTYLFNHAGRPDLTQAYLRRALRHFSTARDGLPGNDDSGTTSGWLVWTMLGLYPNAGQDYYYLGSPVFTKATIKLGNGRKIVIHAPASSDTHKYVSGLRLDGKPWEQAWLRHADLIRGARLDFAMSERPSSWGAGKPPPSLSPAEVE